MKNKYNLIAKCVEGQEYIILDLIATKLNKKDFEIIKENNPQLFAGCYRFISFEDSDCSWWHRVTKLLTHKKLYKNVCFHCDALGNVTKF